MTFKLAEALAELIAQRGFARRQGQSGIDAAWKAVTDEPYRSRTRIGRMSRGILTVYVNGSAILSELMTFQKPLILERLTTQHPDLKIKDLKFRLD